MFAMLIRDAHSTTQTTLECTQNQWCVKASSPDWPWGQKFGLGIGLD